MIETMQTVLQCAVSFVHPRRARLSWLLPALCLGLGCGASGEDTPEEEVMSQEAGLSFSPPVLPAVLKNANNGLYLDVAGISTANGAQVWGWSFTGGSNQEWQFTSMGNGTYEIVSRNSGKCLDVPNNSSTNGQKLQQYDCWGGASQLFTLQTVNGNAQIVAQGSGKCLQSADQGNGASVVIWDCGTATSQQWSVTVAPSNASLPSGTATLQNASNSRYLDVSGLSKTAGAEVWTWSGTGGANQLWSFKSMGDGTYELVNQNSGQCLDVPGNSTTTGQKMEQWTCNGGSNQRFYLYALAGGKVQIAGQGSSKCLSSSQQSDGSSVTIQPCNMTDASQQWSVSGSGKVFPAKFAGNITTNGQPRSDTATYWNQITPENEGKWGSVQPSQGTWNWAPLDAIYKYANDNNLVFKEHTFVWGAQQPNWVNNSNGQTAVRAWMQAFCQRYPNVKIIDVVNEPPPHTTPAYKDGIGGDGASGYDWIVNSFKWAREFCPNAILVLNDYNNIEYAGDNSHTIDIVNKIKAAGAPIDAVGCQAHGAFTIDTNTVKSYIDNIASKTGLPVYITEYDINLADDTQQANVMSSQFPMFWTNPNVKGVTLWGYIVGSTWQTNTGLMTSSGVKRPAMTWLMNYLGR